MQCVGFIRRAVSCRYRCTTQAFPWTHGNLRFKFHATQLFVITKAAFVEYKSRRIVVLFKFTNERGESMDFARVQDYPQKLRQVVDPSAQPLGYADESESKAYQADKADKADKNEWQQGGWQAGGKGGRKGWQAGGGGSGWKSGGGSGWKSGGGGGGGGKGWKEWQDKDKDKDEPGHYQEQQQQQYYQEQQQQYYQEEPQPQQHAAASSAEPATETQPAQTDDAAAAAAGQ